MKNLSKKNSFSVFQVIKSSFSKLWDNIGVLIPTALIITTISTLLFLVIPALRNLEYSAIILNVVTFGLYYIYIAITLGSIKQSLEISRHNKTSISTLLSGFQLSKILRILVAGLIIGLTFFPAIVLSLIVYKLLFLSAEPSIVTLALGSIFILLLFLATTYICMRVAFYIYFIVDKNAKIIESLNLSWIATKGHIGKIVSCSLMLISLELILTLISYYLIFGVNNVYILPVKIKYIAYIMNIITPVLLPLTGLVWAQLYVALTHKPVNEIE